ncbi:MAG: hypothetical protein FJ344_06815 [Sphingomonadales bacterium]|nr:hypothetical protein [Sphingomonadales bacterium]
MRILRHLVAVVVALLSGMLVNGGLVSLGHRLIPLPGGLSGDTPKALSAAISLMGAEHFLFPWLAHAGGNFVSALLVTLISQNRSFWLPTLFGVLFLAGGTYIWRLFCPQRCGSRRWISGRPIFPWSGLVIALPFGGCPSPHNYAPRILFF